ncbi:unnamed protein product, partial [Brenthis ino]
MRPFLLQVTSNPLQGLQSCPIINYQQNYVNADQLARASSFDAYPQQLFYPNQWPSPQNIPNLYQDQSNRYYDNFLINVIPNAQIDTNIPMYSQNGFEVMQYQPNLMESSPQLMNNYIIVPENYLNDQLFDNRRNVYVPSTLNGYTNENMWIPRNSNPIINYYDPVQNPVAYIGNNGNQNIKSTQQSNTEIYKQFRDRNENEKESIERKSSKKNRKRKKNTTKSCKNDENQGTKSKTSKSNKDSSLLTRQTDISNQKFKANNNTKNNKPKTQRRSKSNKIIDENTEAKDITVKDCALRQDFNECLDINEDCTSLENRFPRNNNKNNQVQTFQQQYPNVPQDFTNNIASYLANFMPNQNFNANLFNGNGNFPYNFDYLYQMPQQSNVNSNENDRRRRNRRRKKKSKSNRQSNTSQSSNKQQNNEDNCNKVVELSTKSAEINTMTGSISYQDKNNKCEQEKIIENKKKQRSNRKPNTDQSSNKQQNIEDNCNKVVELSPKSLERETLIEPIPNLITNKKNQKQVIEVKTTEKTYLDIINEPNTEIVLEPSITLLQKHDLNSEVLNDEDIPNVYDNDIFDDYYPDFTSDSIYLSKEDHDWNFHDRHYYTSDNNAEMSTERRRYEPNARRSLEKKQFDTTETVPKHNSDNIREMKALTEETNFKTPPGLEFPDFKTEMINKNKYSPKTDINFQPNANNNYQSDKISAFSNVKTSGNKNNNILDNTVETVYARSKVVKYGGSEPHEKISRKSSNINKNNNVTNNDKATIIVAESVDSPESYK